MHCFTVVEVEDWKRMAVARCTDSEDLGAHLLQNALFDRAQLLANKAQPESAFCLGGTVNVAARWAIVIPLWSNGF